MTIDTHDDPHAAMRGLFRVMFESVPPGTEAATRSPIGIEVCGEAIRFVADPKFHNGWRFEGTASAGTVGPHDQLFEFADDFVARIVTRRMGLPAKSAIQSRFPYAAFTPAADRERLCRELAEAIDEQLRTAPHPAVMLDAIVRALNEVGHELKSWSSDEVWFGRRLLVTRQTWDDDGEVEPRILVELREALRTEVTD